MKRSKLSNMSKTHIWHSSWSAMPGFIKHAFIKKFAFALMGILLSIFSYFVLESFKTPVSILFVSFCYIVIFFFEYKHITNGALISIDLICRNIDYQVKSFWKFNLSSTTKITLYFKGLKDDKVYFLLAANSKKLKIGDQITIYLFPQDLHISDCDTFYISNYISIQKIKNTVL